MPLVDSRSLVAGMAFRVERIRRGLGGECREMKVLSVSELV
jgi:hypothetical protein